MISYSTVTRVEVIDHTHGGVSVYPNTPRLVIGHGVHVDIDLQDEGRTLKIFLTRPDRQEP
jgi:hypothetical protein